MQLDTVYGQPGFLLLARDALDERLGCVGLRELSNPTGLASVQTGEVRRLFVRPSGRGAGVGAALMQRLHNDAVAVGFERLVLNTLPAMVEAMALYEEIGFAPCDPYVDEPLENTLYFALDL